MANSIDKRVVQMTFDNKSFESNAKQTMSTLSKLKAALSNLGSSNKALSSLEKTGKATGIDAIAKSVESLEKRFSTLGIVGMRVIQNLTDGLMGGLSRGLNFVTEGITQGGIRRATNLENAHYQLQALLKDEEKVQAVMSDANKAVDGTAYSFDEAAKAAAMFSASGIKAGEPMENALKGIVGTAAMTNAEFERISLIFTSVAGQGRLMGDQLLQLSSLGLNAPATIAEYFNKIDDSSTKASDEVRAAVKEISKGTKVTEGDIRDLVSEGQISFKIFAEAMYDAFGDSAEKANETFTGAMSNIKSALARIGAGFISPLIEQNSKVIGLINRVREKINEVKSFLVFDEELNNLNAYSKRFTDFVLDMSGDLAKFVENLDIESGMKVFYNVVDSVINILQALGSILAPIGQAFADVFLSFNVGDVINATASLKDFTEGMKLSEEQSKNLHDVFEGVFSVVKLVAGGFLSLLQAIFPVTDAAGSLGDGILSLAGYLGRGLTEFANWVKESKLVAAAFNLVKSACSAVWGAIGKVIDVIKDLILKASEMKVVEKVVSFIGEAFKALSAIAKPAIDFVVSGIKAIVEWLGQLASSIGGAAWGFLVSMFEKLRDALSNFNQKKFSQQIDDIFESLKNLVSLGKGGFGDFISNIKTFGENVKSAFNFSKIVENLKTFKQFIQDFVGWFKETISNVFGGATFGGIVASGGGVALMYAIIKIANALKEATSKLDDVPKVLESVGGALTAYAGNLKADSLKKSAEAILALSAALVVLSFTDTDKALEASFALSIISGVLMVGTSKLLEAAGTGKGAAKKIDKLAKGLGKAFNQLGKAAKWAAIGGAIKSMGESVLMVAGSIIAIGLMHKNYSSEMEEAEKTVAVIASVMVAVMSVMTLLNKKMKNGGAGFLQSAGGMALIALSLANVVKSIKKVMDIGLPSDYQKKMGIIQSLLAELAAITVVLSMAANKAGSNKIKATPIIALAVSLKLVISSLKSVMAMELPSDFGIKLGIMAAMFVGLGGLILAVGEATKKAGSALKGTAVLLALAVNIGVITGALMILSLVPGEGLLKGAISLGAVLLALSKALSSVSANGGEGDYKVVLSMALTVAAIAASLGILSMVPVEDLSKAAIALGAMLLVLSKNLAAAAAITNEGIWKPIVAMAASVVVIAGSLVALASYPWENMLSAGASLGGVILAFSYAFQTLSNSGSVNLGSAASFLAMTLAVIPIGGALSQLASEPWSGLLASAAALSATILAFSAAYRVVASSGNPNLGAAVSFLAMTLAVIPIGAALSQLAAQPWQGLLSAAVAMSGTLLAFSAAFKIISGSSPNLGAVVAFVACAVALIPISVALDMLAAQSWQSLLTAAVALGGVAAALSAAMLIMGAASTSIVGVIAFVAGAVALIPIAGVIQTLSGLSWQEVATGLIALAGGLVIIGAAGLAGIAVAPGLLALSAALLVFAAAIAAVGVAIPVFVNGLSVLVDSLGNAVSFLGNAVSGMIEAGKNLMQGLFNGIVEGASAVIEGIKNIGESVIDGVKHVFGINSPSTVFAAIGDNVDKGFIQGISGGANGISVAMNSVFGGLAEMVDTSSFAKKGAEAAANISSGLSAEKPTVESTVTGLFDASNASTDSFSKKGEEGGRHFEGGLTMAAPLINQAMSSMMDASGIDMSSFTRKGEEGAKNTGSGLENGGSFVKQIMSSIMNGSGIDVSSFTGKGAEGANNLTQGLMSGQPMIQEVMNSMMDGSGIDTSSLTSLGEDGANGLLSGLESGEPMIQQMMSSMMDGSGIDISGMMNLGTKGSESLNSGLKSGEGNVKNTMKSLTDVSGVNVSNYNKVGKNAADAFSKGLTSGAKSGASSAASTVANTFKSAINGAIKGSNYTSAGKSIADSITKGIKSGAGQAKSAAQSLAKNAVSAIKSQQGAFKSAGSNSMSGYVTGLKSKSGEVSNAVKSVAKKASEFLKSEVKQFQKIGSNMISTLSKGIKSKESEASSAAKDISGKIVNGLEGKVKDFQSPGRNAATTYIKALSSALNSGMQTVINQMATKGQQIVQGLARGINANIGVARQAASTLARQIDQQIRSDLQIHSPSKLAEKRGEQVAEGLAKGIKGGTAKVKSATDMVTKVVKQELKSLKTYMNQLYEVPKGSKNELIGLGKALTKIQNLDASDSAIAKINEQMSEWGDKNFAKNGLVRIGEAAKQVANARDGWEDIGNALKSLTSVKNVDKAVRKLNKGLSVKVPMTYANGWDSIGKAIKKVAESEDVAGTVERLNDESYQLSKVKDGWYTVGKAIKNVANAQNGWDSIARAINNKLIADTGKDIYQTQRIQREKQYWQDLLATKQAGADKEKYLDMDMVSFKKEIQQEYSDIINEYNQKVEEQRSSVKGWYDPFKEIDKNSLKTREEVAEANYQAALKEAAAEDAKAAAQRQAEKTSKSKKKTVEEETKVSQVQKETVTSFTKMLKDQGKAAKLYDKTYGSLQKKLKGTTLWDYVKEQGQDSLQFLIELDNMSHKELKKNVKQYDENLKIAEDITKKRTTELRKETKKAVKDLFTIDGSVKDKQSKDYLESLTVEEQYWTKLLAIKQNGADQEKYLEMDIKSFREETLNSAVDLMNNFNDQVESIKSNMNASLGLFDAVSNESKHTADELLQIAKDRTAAFEEFAATMESLSQKLGGTALFEHLSTLGIDSLGELRTINGMTGEQLAEYASEWDRGLAAAGEAAKTGIDKVKEETKQGLSELLDISAEEINLDEFISGFDGTLESLEAVILKMGDQVATGKEKVVDETTSMMKETNDSIKNGLEEATSTAETEGAKVGEALATGIAESATQAAEAGTIVADTTAQAMSAENGDFQNAGNVAGQTYANAVSEKTPEAENSGDAIANATLGGITSKYDAAGNVGTGLAVNVVNAISSMASAFYEAGANLGQGFVDGINSKVSAARAAAQALADAAKTTVEEDLDINSPSKVMKKIGMFTGIGFIDGLMSCVSKAAMASEELSDGVVDGFDTGLSDIFTDDMFSDPIIRPEVDLSSVEQSVYDISKMFSDAIQIATIDAENINIGLSNARRKSDQSELQTGKSKEEENVTNWNFVQNNYSPKALSETDIYRQTKNQFSLFRTVVARA